MQKQKTDYKLVDYLKEGNYNIRNLDGNIELNEANFQIYRAEAKEPLPILVQSGYLTIKNMMLYWNKF